MGFRFRKRIRIAPGLAINISKSGVSTSIGGKGSTINIGKKRRKDDKWPSRHGAVAYH